VTPGELLANVGGRYEIAVSFIPPGEACFDVIERAVPQAILSGDW
jgi:hypothetical protein